MTTFEFKAERRTRVGKGASRALRRDAKVPAVIYGDKKEPVPIVVSYKEADQKITSGGFLTNIISIDVEGEKFQVLPRDYQLNPVRDFVEHIDFLRVTKKTKITVGIPVTFINDEVSPGLKRGGNLNIVRHEVDVICPALEIPDSIVIDLAEAMIGDSIHISAVTLPKGVTPAIRDRDFTIATIAAPGGGVDDEDDEATEVEATEVEATPEA